VERVLGPVAVQDAQDVARVVPEAGRVVEGALGVESEIHRRARGAGHVYPAGPGRASGEGAASRRRAGGW